jgi:hypothetical protein
MTKNEKTILINKYKEELELLNNGYDYKEESVKTLKILLDNLGLNIDRIKIDNDTAIKEWCFLAKDSFKMLFDNLLKRNYVMDIDLFINESVDDFIEFEIEDEETKKCNKACLRNIRNWNHERGIVY